MKYYLVIGHLQDDAPAHQIFHTKSANAAAKAYVKTMQRYAQEDGEEKEAYVDMVFDCGNHSPKPEYFKE